MDLTLFEKIEEWFLGLKCVNGTKIEDLYFSWYRLYNKIIQSCYRNPKNFFENIITYRKFLVRDMWFDHYYLFSILKDKLENDSKMYKKYGMTVHAKLYANQMNDCVHLLNRIIKDEYDEYELKSHDQKWGEINFNINKHKTWSGRSGVNTDEDAEIERKEFKKCIYKAHEKRTKDIKDLFDKLNNNILNWWD